MKPAIPFVLACVALVGCGAWTVSAEPAPVGYAEITSAPVENIELYPSTIYENRTVYLYNDHWYYREGSRWRYYRSEPPALAPHRQRFRAQPAPTHRPQPQPRRDWNNHPQHQPQGHEQDRWR